MPLMSWSNTFQNPNKTRIKGRRISNQVARKMVKYEQTAFQASTEFCLVQKKSKGPDSSIKLGNNTKLVAAFHVLPLCFLFVCWP